MQTMLLRLAGLGPTAETVRRILAVLPQPPTPSNSRDGGLKSAVNAAGRTPTSREIEVLVLLRNV